MSEEALNQNEIDRAFKALHNTLEENKQQMKRELSQKYQATKDTLLHYKHQTESAQTEISKVTALVEDALQCQNDMTLLTQEEVMESKLEDLQEQMKPFPLNIEEPGTSIPVIMNSETLRKVLVKSNYLNVLAEPKKCQIEGSFLTGAETGKNCVLTMDLLDSKGSKCLRGEQKVQAQLRSIRDGTITEGRVELLSPGNIQITFEPQTRGRKELTVTVRGQHIANSPMPIYVHMPPNQLEKPTAQVRTLQRPAGLTHCGNSILVLECDQNRIAKINTAFEKAGFFGEVLHGLAEATSDQQGNIYVTSDVHNRVFKFTSEGRYIQSAGTLGILQGQFNFPNGLRVNSKEELYICDSENGRIQVFDLDLNFKREFGSPGTGKSQFKFPSDVDFDSNDNVYIVDSRNHRIQVFTPGPQEQFIRMIGTNKFGSKELKYPLNMHIVKDHLFITDVHKGCIMVYKLSGELVTTIGKGILDQPEGIEIDEDGYIFVTSHFSKVVIF